VLGVDRTPEGVIGIEENTVEESLALPRMNAQLKIWELN